MIFEANKKHTWNLGEITAAILKSKSPSCGYGKVYDGTFTRTIRGGNGITAGLLAANGIRVYSEEELDVLFEKAIGR
ncbi:DUF523 domain-containing protein [Desulfitobacterium sp. AusDCA]